MRRDVSGGGRLGQGGAELQEGDQAGRGQHLAADLPRRLVGRSGKDREAASAWRTWSTGPSSRRSTPGSPTRCCGRTTSAPPTRWRPQASGPPTRASPSRSPCCTGPSDGDASDAHARALPRQSQQSRRLLLRTVVTNIHRPCRRRGRSHARENQKARPRLRGRVLKARTAVGPRRAVDRLHGYREISAKEKPPRTQRSQRDVFLSRFAISAVFSVRD